MGIYEVWAEFKAFERHRGRLGGCFLVSIIPTVRACLWMASGNRSGATYTVFILDVPDGASGTFGAHFSTGQDAVKLGVDIFILYVFASLWSGIMCICGLSFFW